MVYNTDLDILTPQMCFHAAIAYGSNMLLLVPAKEIDINKEPEASVSQLLSEPVFLVFQAPTNYIYKTNSIPH